MRRDRAGVGAAISTTNSLSLSSSSSSCLLVDVSSVIAFNLPLYLESFLYRTKGLLTSLRAYILAAV